jgi:RHS repeat-associated protein
LTFELRNRLGAVTYTDSYEYDGFGNQINSTGSTSNVYLYRGEAYDNDLGLYYLRARYYNPLTGRFMSRDPEQGNPYDPKSLHKFLYAEGDPVNLIDPSGRDATLQFVFTTADVSSPSIPGLLAFAQDVTTAYCVLTTALSVRAFLHPDENPRPVPILPEVVGACLGRTVASAFGYW